VRAGCSGNPRPRDDSRPTRPRRDGGRLHTGRIAYAPARPGEQPVNAIPAAAYGFRSPMARTHRVMVGSDSATIGYTVVCARRTGGRWNGARSKPAQAGSPICGPRPKRASEPFPLRSLASEGCYAGLDGGLWPMDPLGRPGNLVRPRTLSHKARHPPPRRARVFARLFTICPGGPGATLCLIEARAGTGGLTKIFPRNPFHSRGRAAF